MCLTFLQLNRAIITLCVHATASVGWAHVLQTHLKTETCHPEKKTAQRLGNALRRFIRACYVDVGRHKPGHIFLSQATLGWQKMKSVPDGRNYGLTRLSPGSAFSQSPGQQGVSKDTARVLQPRRRAGWVGRVTWEWPTRGGLNTAST